MRIAFTRWRYGGLLNRPSPRKRLLAKKKTSSGFEFVSGLADGASAMPAKWNRPVFSFRLYEGKISRALHVMGRLRWRRAAASRKAVLAPIPRIRAHEEASWRPSSARYTVTSKGQFEGRAEQAS